MPFENVGHWTPFVLMMVSFVLTPWFFLIVFGYPIRNSFLIAFSIPMMVLGFFCLAAAGFIFGVVDQQPLEVMVAIVFPLGIQAGGSYLLFRAKQAPTPSK